MPLSSDEAYDRAARKIWRAFVAVMWAPLPLILVHAWLRRADRIQFSLLLVMVLFWCGIALPYFLVVVRRGFRSRSTPIAKATGIFCLPLLMFMRLPADIVKHCGGGDILQISVFTATFVLGLLLCLWIGAIDKIYQAALPLETSSPALNHSAAPAIQSSGPSGPPII